MHILSFLHVPELSHKYQIQNANDNTYYLWYFAVHAFHSKETRLPYHVNTIPLTSVKEGNPPGASAQFLTDVKVGSSSHWPVCFPLYRPVVFFLHYPSLCSEATSHNDALWTPTGPASVFTSPPSIPHPRVVQRQNWNYIPHWAWLERVAAEAQLSEWGTWVTPRLRPHHRQKHDPSTIPVAIFRGVCRDHH